MGHRTLAMGGLFALLVGAADLPATAADNVAPPSSLMPSAVAEHGRLAFEIPAQPLAEAIGQFGARTGLPVVFDAALVQGRRSSALHGSHEPLQALQTLLEGSGLVAQYARPGRTDALVVLRAPRAADPAEAPEEAPALPPSAGVTHRRYDGLMQARVSETFCANPLLARGGHRIAVQFHVDPTGWIQGARLLDSTGDAARDAAVIAALETVRLDWAPPATMAQPVTMVIQPRVANLCQALR